MFKAKILDLRAREGRTEEGCYVDQPASFLSSPTIRRSARADYPGDDASTGDPDLSGLGFGGFSFAVAQKSVELVVESKFLKDSVTYKHRRW